MPFSIILCGIVHLHVYLYIYIRFICFFQCYCIFENYHIYFLIYNFYQILNRTTNSIFQYISDKICKSKCTFFAIFGHIFNNIYIYLNCHQAIGVTIVIKEIPISLHSNHFSPLLFANIQFMSLDGFSWVNYFWQATLIF